MSSEQSSDRTNKGFALILGAAQVAGLSAPHSNDAILAENGVDAKSKLAKFDPNKPFRPCGR